MITQDTMGSIWSNEVAFGWDLACKIFMEWSYFHTVVYLAPYIEVCQDY
jgi:hypothetical protein